MEPLWSPVVATGGKRWQVRWAETGREQAETVAVGCDQLPSGPHGKQGVCRELPPVAGGPPPCEGGGRSPYSAKRQVLRTRRPTGLDGATLTRSRFVVKRVLVTPWAASLAARNRHRRESAGEI